MAAFNDENEEGSVLEDGVLAGLIGCLLAAVLPVYSFLTGQSAGFFIIYMILTPIFWIISGILGGYLCHRHGRAFAGQHGSTGAVAGGITGGVGGIMTTLIIQYGGTAIFGSMNNIWLIIIGCTALPAGLGAATGHVLGRITGTLLRTLTSGPKDDEANKLLDSFSRRWIDRHIVTIVGMVVLLLYILYRLFSG